ncbi:unnamed protein product [Chrysoparadoxa australica]
MRDKEWESWTCTLGWPVQGIYPPGSDGTDVNAAHRSPDRKLIATADDLGKLKVFHAPCLSTRAKWVEGAGHSSHVTNVRFTHDQERIITTGGNDKCVFVWRVLKLG